MTHARYLRWLHQQETQLLGERERLQRAIAELQTPTPHTSAVTWEELMQWADWECGVPERIAHLEAALQVNTEALHQCRQQQRQWDRLETRQAEVKAQHTQRAAQRIVDEGWGVPSQNPLTQKPATQ